MDQINPNPPKDVVAYPERCDDISNQPLPDSTTCLEEASIHSIPFSDTSKKSKPLKSVDQKRPLSKPLPPPDPKSPKLDQTTPTQQMNVTGSPSLQPSNSSSALIVLDTLCCTMLNELSSHSRNLEYIVAYFEIRSAILDQVVQYLNSLPIPYANTLPNLQVDRYVQQECHPLFLQTFKPIKTTGDGNCMYNALSLAFCGTEHLSIVIRLLTTYALVKHRTAIIDALSHIYFDGNHEHVQALTDTMHKAIHLGVWGTDLHLFSLSLLNRPIFSYNTFYIIRQSVRILNLPDTVDPHHLAQRFSSRDQGTRGHFLFCSDVLRVSLSSGSITSLPLLPLCLFNILNQYWVALLMLSPLVAAHVPIPTTRTIAYFHIHIYCTNSTCSCTHDSTPCKHITIDMYIYTHRPL